MTGLCYLRPVIVVIPDRRAAASPESITTAFADMDSGFALRAPRNDGAQWACFFDSAQSE